MNRNGITNGKRARILVTLTSTLLAAGSCLGLSVVSTDPPDGPYMNFTNVIVTATPDPGWSFLRWEGDASGTNPVVSVNMISNKTVRAVFGTRLVREPQGQ